MKDKLNSTKIQEIFNSDNYNLIDELLNSFQNDNYKFLKENSNSNVIQTVAIISWSTRYGGRSRVACALSNRLYNLGYKVIYISELEFKYSDYFLKKGIIKVSLKSEIGRREVLIKTIKKYKIDLIIYNNFESSELSKDCVICKLLNVKILIFIHLSFVYFYIKRQLDFFKDFLKQISLADGIIVTNKLDYDFFKVFNKKTYFIYNSIDYINKVFIRKNYVCQNKIIYIARGEDPIKRLNDLIDICLELKKKIDIFKIIVIGKTTIEFVEMIKFNNLENYFELVGVQSNIFKHLSKCAILLSTSVHETFGMTLAEGLYYSKPIVMYKIPYIPFMKSKGILSSEIGDTTTIADYLYKLISNPEYAKYLGKINKKFIDNMYLNFDFNLKLKQIIKDISKTNSTVNNLDYLFCKKNHVEIYPLKNNLYEVPLPLKKEFNIVIMFIPHLIIRIMNKFKRKFKHKK